MIPPAPILVGGLVLVALLFLFVFPTRTYWAKRSEKDAASRRIEVLRQENKKMEQELKRLNDEDEIARIARERFNLVKPGEDAYAILPGEAAPPTTLVP